MKLHILYDLGYLYTVGYTTPKYNRYVSLPSSIISLSLVKVR